MLKEQVHNFFKSLRHHSIFLKTLAILAILLSLAGLVFFTCMNRIYRDRQRRMILESTGSIIDIVSDSLNTNLSSLRIQAEDYLQTDSTVALALKGIGKDDLNVLDVTLNLSQFVRDNSLTDYASMYVMAGEHVLTSEKKILTSQSQTQTELFRQIPDESGLIQYKDDLYEILYYPQERPLLILAVRIDDQALFQTLSSVFPTDNELWLYYSESPVFPEQLSYPSSQDLIVTNKESSSDRISVGYSTVSSDTLLSYTLPNCRLQWIARIPKTKMDLPGSSLYHTLLPALNMVLLLMLAGSFFLVYLVYKPMEATLTSIITASNSRQIPRASNELELIRDVCQQMEIRQETMRNMLSQVSTAIEERLLRSLLAGEEIQEEELTAALAEVSPDFQMEGVFQIIILSAYYAPEQVCPLRDQELHRWTIEQAVREFWSQTSQLNIFEGQNNERILLLRHPSDYSIRTAKHLITDFELILHELESRLNLHLEYGSGFNFHNLTDLFDARQNAEKNLQERLYYRRGHENSEAIWLGYSKKAEEMLQAELTASGQYTHNIRLLIQEAMSVPENAPIICSRICNVILERLIQMNIPVEDSWLSFRRNLEDNQEPLLTTDPRYEELEHFLSDSLQALENAAGDEKYHYIENACRYIESHYTDCNLSLNTVSEYCGISSSYLSRLFTSYMPPGFVEYLNQYRIRQAENLLLSTSYTIVEIGFKTGFNSPQNFSRVFKKYHGKTPGQFRTQGKENA